MPYPSERKRILRECNSTLEKAVVCDLLEDDLRMFLCLTFPDLLDFEELLFGLARGRDSQLIEEIRSVAEVLRYVAPRYRLPKSRAYMSVIFPSMSAYDFQQLCRMDRGSFQRVAELL